MQTQNYAIIKHRNERQILNRLNWLKESEIKSVYFTPPNLQYLIINNERLELGAVFNFTKINKVIKSKKYTNGVSSLKKLFPEIKDFTDPDKVLKRITRIISLKNTFKSKIEFLNKVCDEVETNQDFYTLFHGKRYTESCFWSMGGWNYGHVEISF